ncbi:aminoacyl tRNA synthase complex-interacting multifunctional protein 2-like isoform X3 [Ostrinia nubilalis]|uniref:aminoacyl tRNA synthase complex-interacting multifunctional protein 2-like isoform X3 n=1 Tax=Ostrinia nubilalis TaxID=29057 RepID=UPI0030825CB6
MMYRMKKIISHDEVIELPKCMYHVKNPNEALRTSEIDINISDQAPNIKMTELEHRQDVLLKKLDVLYERIKTISSICTFTDTPAHAKTGAQVIPMPEEVVLNINPDSLPWYLNVFLKDSPTVASLSWHIHSSVPNEKVAKIKAFVKNLKSATDSSKINLRLIFKSVSADPELKLSTLAVPIIGNVNILRYLCLVYPTVLPYDYKDYNMEGLLDLCHLLEKTPEKNKEAIILKIFAQSKGWICNGQLSIVDIAVYNVIKQLRSRPKSVPKDWFDKCEKLYVCKSENKVK